MSAPISHVNVWPQGNELMVTWRGGGDVSVFVSDDPVDAGIDVRAPDAPGVAAVPRSGRTYIHLFDPERGFTVAAERLVGMDGVLNFRDLGGYPTAHGADTRWGSVFRSGRLDEATDADLARMADLGITTVFDLRTDGEVERQPDRLPDGVNWVHLPMSSNVAVQKGLFERIVDGDVTSFTETDMADGYLRMLDRFGEYQARIVRAVGAGERVLFHCTAGKDRTGITAMTLLGIADVADMHVLDDYEVSARHQPQGIVEQFAEQLTAAGIDVSGIDLAAMLGSPRPVLRMTMAALRDRWGSLDGYVAATGLQDHEVSAARSNLLATEL